MSQMTPEQIDAIDELRAAGFAVTVMTPDELDGASPSKVEDLMWERAWNAVGTLACDEDTA
jgi:hypothetical protein